MIDELRLRNFKCFAELDLKLAPLTILSGGNGAGKSSIIQSLLLLRQSALHGELIRGRTVFNGDLVRLGSAAATLRDDAPIGAASEIGIAWTDGQSAGFRLSDEADKVPSAEGTAWLRLPPVASCRYVSAERVGPRAAFPTSDVLVRTADDIGSQGEFAAHYLAVNGAHTIPLSELHFTAEALGVEGPDAASPKLKDEVEGWLGLLAPGVRLDVELQQMTDVVSLGFRFPGPTGLSDARRSTHVGFGLTYILPILVAILSARPGTLVMIENPEAHLHPGAQRLLVQLFARAAEAGIQLIIETHSDHVLNGVRVAVRRKTLKADHVAIHFFAHNATAQPQVTSPRVQQSGAISEWPRGFFDEWDRALDDLLG